MNLNSILKNSKSNFYLHSVTIFFLVFSILRLSNQRFYSYFLINEARGDEALLVDSFNYFLNHGWYNSIALGSSSLFNLFSLPFYFITHDILLSFKLLNLLCLFILITIWAKFLLNKLGLDKKYLLITVLFFIQVVLTQVPFFRGSNDPLFCLFISLGFIYLYRGISEDNKKNYLFILSAIFFSLALSVRELIFLYLPGIILVILIGIIKKSIKFSSVVLFIITFVLFAIAIQYPSLVENKTISMLDKNPKNINANWSERNYLQVLNSSKERPTWEEVVIYKKQHGENSLPKSFLNSILKDPKLTVNHFFKQFYLSQLPFVIKLGLFYVFFLAFISYLFIKKSFFNKSFLWIPFIFYGFYTIFLTLLIIPNLEFRWLIVFPLLISAFSISEIAKLFDKNHLVEKLFYINILVISISNSFLIGIW